jgi:hypothetical protein
MATKARRNRSRTGHRCNRCFSRLRVAPKFSLVLTKASKSASVRMPVGLTGGAILEWFSLPWDEAIRRDSSFSERHQSRPVVLRSQVAGYPAGTRAMVSGVRIEPVPSFKIRTPDGQLFTVRIEEVIFDDA